MNELIEKNSEAAAPEVTDYDDNHHGVDANPIYANASEDFADRDRLAIALKMKLKALRHINAVWLEDLGHEIYVHIDTSDTGKSTLRSIFDAQYDIEEEYPRLTFHFRVDSLELEQKLASHQLVPII